VYQTLDGVDGVSQGGSLLAIVTHEFCNTFPRGNNFLRANAVWKEHHVLDAVEAHVCFFEIAVDELSQKRPVVGKERVQTVPVK